MTQSIRLIAFPGAPNLPVFLGIDDGHFERHGVSVELTTTPSSIFQFEQFSAGNFDIAGTAFDNVVAYREHQGAAELDGPLDVAAFMGASQIELSLIAPADITSVAQLARAKLAMDAKDTGFAFVAYHMLEAAGVDRSEVELDVVGATPQRFAAVRDGTHCATLTIEPFTSMARAEGLNVLATSTACFDAYQGGVFAATEAWSTENTAAVDGFVNGYLDALAIALDPGSRDLSRAVLLRNMPAIKTALVDRILDNLMNARTGLSKDGGVGLAGMNTVLDLRRQYHPLGKQVREPTEYLKLHPRITAVA